MTALSVLLPWDLDRRLPCLPKHARGMRVVLLESRRKSLALPYHRQKLVLVLSALRHFAAELEREGFEVEIHNAKTYADGLREVVQRHKPSRVAMMRPREWGIARSIDALIESGLGRTELTLHDDGGEGSHFLLSRKDAQVLLESGRDVRLDRFYRQVRERFGWLIDARGKPVGGKWSFDALNREVPPPGVRPPKLPSYEPDALTRAQIERVRTWGIGWGALEPFDWPVTRADALRELEHFFEVRASGFGPYEDAMLHGERWMWHTRLSASMNLGLISARDVCDRVINAHREGALSLASAEGLLRQVAGWRELMRAAYWARMPGMRDANHLEASRPLPAFYWEPSQTKWACLRSAAQQVHDTGYAHHIQRLMVLGNFALLFGARPLEVSHWFWAGFVDAYEWVQLPNVHGMALFADPAFTTKPYAASGAYIHRMSDHCEKCPADPKKRHGDGACPYNPLFWSFLDEHRERFLKHPRIGALYRTWDRFSEEERQSIRVSAERLRSSLVPYKQEWSFRDDDG